MVDEGGDLFEPPPRLLLILAVISLIQILDSPNTLSVVGLLVFLVVFMEVGDQRDHLEVRRPNNTNQEKQLFFNEPYFFVKLHASSFLSK